MPRALALAAVLFLLGAPAAAAQQQPPVAIVDADEPLAIAAEAVPVRILNNTNTKLTITVSATAVADDGRKTTVEVQDAPPALEPGGDAWVRVKVDSPPSAEIEGYLVVVADGVVVRRPLSVAAAGAVPAVDAWDTEWAAFLPHGDSYALPGRVPVDGECRGGGSTTIVSGHDTAKLTATCADGGLRLTMTDESSSGPGLGVGEYKGTLELGDEDLAVTVDSSAPMLVALLCLVGGILGALVGSTFTSDRRPHNARRTAIDAIVPPDGPLGDAVRAARVRLAADLDATRPSFFRRLMPWPTGGYATELAAIDKDTARLRDVSHRVTAYQDGLASLNAHRQALSARMPTAAFDSLATPPRTTAALLADHVDDVLAVPALVEVDKRMTGLEAAIDRAEDGPDKAKAETGFRKLNARLGRLDRPTGIVALRTDLDALTGLVDGLKPRTGIMAESAALPGGVSIPWEAIQKFLSGTGTTAMAARDIGVALLIGVLALATGFAALYVAADTWGTLWDILAAVTWGVGATAVSGPLLTSIRRIGSTRQ